MDKRDTSSSDTPETDAEYWKWYPHGAETQAWEHARRLERQRDELAEVLIAYAHSGGSPAALQAWLDARRNVLSSRVDA